MFKNIVVSVDGSEPSTRALTVAADMAQRYDADLTIVHAVMDDASVPVLMDVAKRHGFVDQIIADLDEATSTKSVPAPITAAPLVAVPEDILEKIGQLLLEETASKVRALGLETVETALLGEDAAQEILHFAETNDVELIVCGTRGLGAIKRFFLGSVSHKLLEEAKCPCLVVK